MKFDVSTASTRAERGLLFTLILPAAPGDLGVFSMFLIVLARDKCKEQSSRSTRGSSTDAGMRACIAASAFASSISSGINNCRYVNHTLQIHFM